jgi:Spy/CpxP family protein refolding chaperone
MRTFGILALLMFLAAPAVAAPDRPATRPVFHEETSSVWDELSHRFQDMRDRFREHFGGFRDGAGERPLISMMLSRRDELNLSSEQVKNLERLRTDFEREAVKNEGDLRVAELDLSEILKADSVDVKRAEAKVREIERLRAELRIARIRAIEQAKTVLSQEQREKLRAMTTGSRYSRKPEGEKF